MIAISNIAYCIPYIVEYNGKTIKRGEIRDGNCQGKGANVFIDVYG